MLFLITFKRELFLSKAPRLIFHSFTKSRANEKTLKFCTKTFSHLIYYISQRKRTHLKSCTKINSNWFGVVIRIVANVIEKEKLNNMLHYIAMSLIRATTTRRRRWGKVFHNLHNKFISHCMRKFLYFQEYYSRETTAWYEICWTNWRRIYEDLITFFFLFISLSSI